MGKDHPCRYVAGVRKLYDFSKSDIVIKIKNNETRLVRCVRQSVQV